MLFRYYGDIPVTEVPKHVKICFPFPKLGNDKAPKDAKAKKAPKVFRRLSQQRGMVQQVCTIRIAADS